MQSAGAAQKDVSSASVEDHWSRQAYLRDDVEPCVDRNRPEAVHDRRRHLRDVAVLEPEGQEAQRVLERAIRREGDRAEEG